MLCAERTAAQEVLLNTEHRAEVDDIRRLSGSWLYAALSALLYASEAQAYHCRQADDHSLVVTALLPSAIIYTSLHVPLLAPSINSHTNCSRHHVPSHVAYWSDAIDDYEKVVHHPFHPYHL